MKTNSINKDIPIGIGLLTLYFHLPGIHSLKEKRSIIKPILARLKIEFKVAAAEVGYQEKWQESMLACVTVSSDSGQSESLLQYVYRFIE